MKPLFVLLLPFLVASCTRAVPYQRRDSPEEWCKLALAILHVDTVGGRYIEFMAKNNSDSVPAKVVVYLVEDDRRERLLRTEDHCHDKDFAIVSETDTKVGEHGLTLTLKKVPNGYTYFAAAGALNLPDWSSVGSSVEGLATKTSDGWRVRIDPEMERQMARPRTQD